MRIAGVLVGIDGSPVAGATVHLAATARSNTAEDHRKTTTAPDGTFVFESLLVRSYTLHVRHDRYYAQRYVVSDAPHPIRLQLQPGVTVDVRVTHTGEPVADARVDLDGTTAQTDAAGIARFEGIAPEKVDERDHQLFVIARGFAQHFGWRPLRGAPLVEIELERGARFAGVVRGPLGRLVPDAPIIVWQEPNSGKGPRYARSREDGTWYIDLPAGQFRARAALAPFEPLDEVILSSDGATNRDGFVLNIGFQSAGRGIGAVISNALRPLADPARKRIKGIVVDDRGTPCIATVTARRQESFIERTVRTHEDGLFELDELTPGAAYLVSAEWTRRASYRVTHTNVRPGEQTVRLVLSSGATVRGRVLLEGAPLSRFGIYLVPPNTSTRGGTIIPFDTVDGRFTLPHVAPGRLRVAIMGVETKQHVVPERVFEHGEDIDLGDIVVERGTRVSGDVRDEHGAAITGAIVRIGLPHRLMWPGTDLERAFSGLYETTTDAAGRYTFGGVATHEDIPRPPLVWATHPRVGASLIRELTSGDADFTLLPTGRLEGHVRGTPGGSVMIRLARPDEADFARTEHTDEIQRFTFDDVPYGDYVASLDMPGSDGVAVRVEVGQTAQVELTVTAALVGVTLRVPEGRGRDVQFEPASPEARIDSRIRGSMTMNGEDSYTIDHVHPGRYRASFDGRTWTEVTVAPSPERQTFDLRSLR